MMRVIAIDGLNRKVLPLRAVRARLFNGMTSTMWIISDGKAFFGKVELKEVVIARKVK